MNTNGNIYTVIYTTVVVVVVAAVLAFVSETLKPKQDACLLYTSDAADE